MATDTIERKRRSGKNAPTVKLDAETGLASGTVALVPVTENVDSIPAETPAETVDNTDADKEDGYRLTNSQTASLLMPMDTVKRQYQQAFLDDSVGEKLKGSGEQRMSLAVMGLFSYWQVKGIVAAGKFPTLADVLTDDSKRKLVIKGANAHFIGKDAMDGVTKKMRGDVGDDVVNERLPKVKARKALITRALDVAAILSRANVTIDAFNDETGNWNIPFRLLCSPEMLAFPYPMDRTEWFDRIVPLDGAGLGAYVQAKSGNGASTMMPFNASSARLRLVGKPATPEAPDAAKDDAAENDDDKSDAQREPRAGDPPAELANVNLGDLSIGKLTGPNGLQPEQVLLAAFALWIDPTTNAPHPTDRKDLPEATWKKVQALAHGLTAMVDAIDWTKPREPFKLGDASKRTAS